MGRASFLVCVFMLVMRGQLPVMARLYATGVSIWGGWGRFHTASGTHKHRHRARFPAIPHIGVSRAQLCRQSTRVTLRARSLPACVAMLTHSNHPVKRAGFVCQFAHLPWPSCDPAAFTSTFTSHCGNEIPAVVLVTRLWGF